MNKQNLIGLVGKAQSGKSTVANYLVEKYNFKKVAFADPLKEMLLRAGMCSREELYDKKTDQSRWLMQKIGTDIFRKQVDWNFWTKIMKKRLCYFRNFDIVIDDIRFHNEADLIRELNGIVIKIEREDHMADSKADLHDSEKLLESIYADQNISAKSGDIESLLRQIEDIVQNLFLEPLIVRHKDDGM
jgi:ABC-type oligopeptide transport system ATPase subunit